ncbi:hypothetical protein QTP88_025256 [Uroleucon formosanum]
MPRRRPGPLRKRPVLWWTAEIAELRRNCLALLRAYQSALKRAGQPGVQAARTDYSTAKRNLRHKIGEAKSAGPICAARSRSIHFKPYKIVMRKLGPRNPGADSRGREAEIADTLFPAAPAMNERVAFQLQADMHAGHVGEAPREAAPAEALITPRLQRLEEESLEPVQLPQGSLHGDSRTEGPGHRRERRRRDRHQGLTPGQSPIESGYQARGETGDPHVLADEVGKQQERRVDSPCDTQRQEVDGKNGCGGALVLPHDPGANEPWLLPVLPGVEGQGPQCRVQPLRREL